MSHFALDPDEAELEELAQGNDLVLWMDHLLTGAWCVWCIALDTGEEDLIGSGATEAEAIEAARQQISIWEARKTA